MGLFSGKKGVILGIANEKSLATGIASALSKEGASLGFSHLPDKPGIDKMKNRVQRAIDSFDPKFLVPCDVRNDEDISLFFSHAKDHFGTIDFMVHSIAYAPTEDLAKPSIMVSREGFKTSMDISVYSFVAVTREASKIMSSGGSIVTLTYFGGEKVVAGYNLMGICKTALESSVRYLSFDLGDKGIRVNGISAGPVKTLATSAMSREGGAGFSDLLRFHQDISPLNKNISQDDVGKAAVFLLSDLASSTTGEILHVDAGYNVMGSPGRSYFTGFNSKGNSRPL